MRNPLVSLYNSEFDTSSTLIVLGAVGWLVSMFAQLTAISTNKNLPPEKKEFLKTQELADGSINTGLYLLLTSGISNMTKRAVDKGKIITQDIFDNLKPEYKTKDKLKEFIKNLDGKDNSITNLMIKGSDEIVDKNKNSLGLLATIGASILSCNILTPLARNKVGAYLVKKNAAKKLDVTEKPIEAPQIMLTPAAYKNNTFDKFSTFSKVSGNSCLTNITRI